ncbi:carboxypeptidase regulatory-like domain-containing protein, partial [Candidatus Dojkabacteria bacterium]|nr:carboxypeptidase regulatory-like domain-containing protein [Candidatus Dojkabacteria bacterium]
MDRRRRLVVIILFLLTITLGVVAIYIGYKLSQQPDLGPDATLAGVDDGTWINLCGTNPPSGDWGQHNSSSCTGCTQSSCSGNVVWIFECSPGEESQENGGTQCTANGRPFSGDFNSNFVDDCKMYQVDVWSDTVFGDLTDFVVWRGNRFGDPSCTSTPNQYSISGRVYCQDDGAGLSGAQIDVLGDGRGNQTTNSSGNYTFSNYDEGFSPNSIELKVDPPSLPGGAQGPFCNSNSLCTCSGGTFTSCGSLTSDFSGMDFFYTQCANANDITISGTVICAEDDSPVSGATVNIIETGQTRTVTTNAQGQFSYTAAIQTPNAIAVRLPDYPNSQKTAINCDGQHPWDIS